MTAGSRRSAQPISIETADNRIIRVEDETDEKMAGETRRVAVGTLVLLVLIAGVLAVRMPRPSGGASPSGAPASPTAAVFESTFSADFLPLVELAVADASVLVATGEARERNLLRIRGQQGAMLESLAAADAWLAEHPPPPAFVPAATAYHDGATKIRDAMDEAQAGFLRFDFDRVARATDMMKQGDSALRLAAARLRAADSTTPLP